MHHVSQRLNVHEAVLDGDVEQLLGEAVERGVESGAGAGGVIADFGFARPIGGSIGGSFAGFGIDAEGEEPIESGVEGREIEGVTREQIPIEGFDMAEVEDEAMAIGDRARIERVWIEQGKHRIGLRSGLVKTR